MISFIRAENYNVSPSFLEFSQFDLQLVPYGLIVRLSVGGDFGNWLWYHLHESPFSPPEPSGLEDKPQNAISRYGSSGRGRVARMWLGCVVVLDQIVDS